MRAGEWHLEKKFLKSVQIIAEQMQSVAHVARGFKMDQQLRAVKT